MVIPVENFQSHDQLATISSREIARLTGITHAEVKRMVTSLETAQRLSQPVTASLYEREGENAAGVFAEQTRLPADRFAHLPGLYGGHAGSLAGA